MINQTNGISAPKRWFTDGATMAFPARHRMVYWVINLLLYVLVNLFFLRVQTGSLNLTGPYESGPLLTGLLSPLNIFYFPTYIVVVALVVAMLCTVAILTSQLYSFLFAIPFVMVVFFVGHNPALTLCLFVSCAMAGFEPLRFKSKFVAAVVCLIPVVLYWVLFSGGENPEQDVRRWAILYAPWALAFLISVTIFGVVLSVGHFLRYRAGVLMPMFALLVAATIVLFHNTIGMQERDFQAEVYQYSPGQMSEFQSHSILPELEAEAAQRRKLSPYLPAERVIEALRLEWRWAFRIGPLQNESPISGGWNSPTSSATRAVSTFIKAQIDAVSHIDGFLAKYASGPREPDTLYYKALLFDINIDHRALRNEDRLEFYWDIPSQGSSGIWEEILTKFSDSEASIEARWRVAKLLASQKPSEAGDSFNFAKSLSLLSEARMRCQEVLSSRREVAARREAAAGWLGLGMREFFLPVPETLTYADLLSLRERIDKLMMLIDKANRTGHIRHEERLAEFVALDSHQLNYDQKLKELTLNSPQPDPLIDNIELAMALLERDPDQRVLRLTDLTRRYADTDGGVEAMLKLSLELLDQRNRIKHVGTRQRLHEESLKQLGRIIKLRPGTFLADEAEAIIKRYPIE